MILGNSQAGNVGPKQHQKGFISFLVNRKLSSFPAEQRTFVPNKKEKREKHQPELFQLL